MRTLNRPMFRYGGPIKEGVMNGIREPKRNGGSMANNEGPRRAALVGNPIFPKDAEGRSKHLIQFALPALAAAGRFAIRPLVKYGANVLRRDGTKIAKKGSTLLNQVGKKVKSSGKFSRVKPVYDKDQKTLTGLGRYFKNSPEAGLITGAGGKITKGIYGTGKYLAKSPLTVASAAGFGGKKLYDALNAEPDKKDPAGVTEINKLKQSIGMPENLTLGGGQNYEGDPPKELTEAEKAKIESDNRIKQMDKYREIMDIKGMSKDAAYKSLIDAGKIIQEGGNLKEQLKSGKLIQNLTQAASKRFDKVGDTEAALRSLVVKGEIENELNKEDKALKRKQLRTAIAASEKSMAGDSFEKVIADYTIKNGQPTGATLTGLARVKGIPIVETIDTKILDTSIKNNETVTDEVTFLQNEVQKGIRDNDPLPPGNYVIKGSIIKVDEEGNVSRAL